MNALLDLKQTRTVEEYTTQFQALQYDVTMHNSNYDEMFFTPQYMRGLREEIRSTVEPQMPQTVLKASTIARIQQGMLERSKAKHNRANYQIRPYVRPKTEYKPPQQTSTLWKGRQLRDHRKANGLCFSCGEKFVPGHLEVCSKRQKPQVNAIVLNDLDRVLSDEVLNELAVEDQLHEEFCQLSLNALSSQNSTNCIKLKARVKDKVLLILVDSGSTHSFISAQFVELAKFKTVPTSTRKVKLPGHTGGDY